MKKYFQIEEYFNTNFIPFILAFVRSGKSFLETVKFLKDLKIDAFIIANVLCERIFCGIHDPNDSNGYCFTKDLLYEEGYMEVAHYLIGGYKKEDLYIGLCSLYEIIPYKNLGANHYIVPFDDDNYYHDLLAYLGIEKQSPIKYRRVHHNMEHHHPLHNKKR